MTKISIIFFGTSDFAVPALKKLAERKDIEIKFVVTRPDRPAGRGLKMGVSPVKRAALDLGLNVVQPEKVTRDVILNEVKDPRDFSADAQDDSTLDLIILAAYGKIIPDDVLKIPKHGALNIHPSLLPKFRGPSPIQTAILEGAAETGVTIMEMVKEMDAGPIVAQKELKLNGTEIYTELHDKLAEMGADLLDSTIESYVTNYVTPVSQNEKEATFTKLFKNEDYEINLNDPAEINLRKIRAFADSPGAFTIKDGQRMKIFRAHVEGVEETTEKGIVLKSGDNKKILVTEYQFEGKKRITI